MNAILMALCVALAGQDLDKPALGVMVYETSLYKKTADKKTGWDLPRRDGMLVIGVLPYSPAATAKINTLDIIAAVNGKAVITRADYDEAMSKVASGEKVRLDILPVSITAKTAWGSSKRAVVVVKSMADIAKAGVKSEKDNVTGVVTYSHRDSPEDTRCSDVSFVFDVADGKASGLNMRVCYEGRSWLFVESILLSTGEDPQVINLKGVRWTRDIGNGVIWEWCHLPMTESIFEKLRPNLGRANVTIRYDGDKFKVDRPFTSEERARMMTVFMAFQSMGGTLPK